MNMNTEIDTMNSSHPVCIRDMLDAHAGHSPDATAIKALGRQPLTYIKLFSLVTTVVEILNKMGLGRNDRQSHGGDY